MKKLNKLVIALAMFVLCFSIPTKASTISIGSSSTPNFINAQFYVLGSSNVPTRTSLSGPDDGYIYPKDLCTVKEVTNSTYWKVEYPTSSGKKTAYVKKSAILSEPSFSTKRISIDANSTVYSKSDMKTSFGTTYTTDTIHLLSNISNGKAQIIYNISGGWKIGWIYTSPTSGSKVSMSSVLYGVPGISTKLSCSFDGYTTTSGRHEGIDFAYGKGKSVYSLTDGEVIRVARGSSSDLSTIAIYYAAQDKTILYLHTNPISTLKVGQKISKGTLIAYEDNRATKSVHTHVEMRSGRRTNAAKSVGDPTLDNVNPKSFWESLGYTVK